MIGPTDPNMVRSLDRDSNSICYAAFESEIEDFPYLCTLRAGHEGDHEAQTPMGHTVKTWSREPTETQSET